MDNIKAQGETGEQNPVVLITVFSRLFVSDWESNVIIVFPLNEKR